MSEAISVRLDDEAVRAPRTLEATGLSRSEAVRSALVRAARALRRHDQLAAEVAELEADDVDRSEMLAVAQLMESLHAPGVTFTAFGFPRESAVNNKGLGLALSSKPTPCCLDRP